MSLVLKGYFEVVVFKHRGYIVDEFEVELSAVSLQCELLLAKVFGRYYVAQTQLQFFLVLRVILSDEILQSFNDLYQVLSRLMVLEQNQHQPVQIFKVVDFDRSEQRFHRFVQVKTQH